MTKEKHFPKTIGNEILVMACLQICRELLLLTTFLRVHSNSKEVSYLSQQNKYPNLKTTCHIKLKFFLWTKRLDIFLLAKYLIFVTATLTFLSHKAFPLVLILIKVFLRPLKTKSIIWKRTSRNLLCSHSWKYICHFLLIFIS